MGGTWEHDWPIRAYERINELGFNSLYEFVDSRPTASLLSLAHELGPGIAAVQLESLWFREAERTDRLSHFLGSLLIRRIRQALPQGWANDDKFEVNLAGAFATWENMADRVLSDPARGHIWDRLRSLPAPSGWLPKVPPDELTSSLLESIEKREGTDRTF